MKQSESSGKKELSKKRSAVQQRRWRAKNKQKVLDYRKRYYSKHREAVIGRAQVYYRNNIEAKRAYGRSRKPDPFKARDKQLQSIYGITAAQWDKIFDLQGGICPICLHKLYKYRNVEGRRAANVDHDHRGNKRIRGLLCWRCNRIRIGNNTTEMVRRMLIYMESEFDGRKL